MRLLFIILLFSSQLMGQSVTPIHVVDSMPSLFIKSTGPSPKGKIVFGKGWSSDSLPNGFKLSAGGIDPPVTLQWGPSKLTITGNQKLGGKLIIDTTLLRESIIGGGYTPIKWKRLAKDTICLPEP